MGAEFAPRTRPAARHSARHHELRGGEPGLRSGRSVGGGPARRGPGPRSGPGRVPVRGRCARHGAHRRRRRLRRCAGHRARRPSLAGQPRALDTSLAPSAFVAGDRRVGRLFPDSPSRSGPLRDTRIFPVTHKVMIRRDTFGRGSSSRNAHSIGLWPPAARPASSPANRPPSSSSPPFRIVLVSGVLLDRAAGSAAVVDSAVAKGPRARPFRAGRAGSGNDANRTPRSSAWQPPRR